MRLIYIGNALCQLAPHFSRFLHNLGQEETFWSEAAMTPTLRLAIITIVASFGYIGLAVPRPWRVCRVLLPFAPDSPCDHGLVLSGVALFSGGNLSPGVRETVLTAGSSSPLV